MGDRESIRGVRVPRAWVLRVLLLCALNPTSLGAQSLSSRRDVSVRGPGATRQDAQTRALCFHPRPIPACRSFILAEMSLMAVLAGSTETVQVVNGPTESFSAFGSHLSWQLGYLRNLSEETAVGGSLLAGYGGPAGRLAARVNVRRWVTDDTSIDVAAGFLRGSVDGYGQQQGSGFTADLRYTYEDRYALTLRTDWLWTKGTFPNAAGFHEFPTARALYAGVTLGRKPALWGTAATGAGLVLYGLLYYLLASDS